MGSVENSGDLNFVNGNTMNAGSLAVNQVFLTLFVVTDSHSSTIRKMTQMRCFQSTVSPFLELERRRREEWPNPLRLTQYMLCLVLLYC